MKEKTAEQMNLGVKRGIYMQEIHTFPTVSELMSQPGEENMFYFRE